MKIKKTYNNIFFCISIILFTLSACSLENASALVLATYLLEDMSWEGDGEYFTPQDGSMEAVLAIRESERLKPALIAQKAITINATTILGTENYTGNQVKVVVSQNEQQIFSVDAGVISPIPNFQGLWAVGEQWVMEVAHVEENPEDPNAAFIIWGEIIQDGDSLNTKFGYQEAFGFQLLQGKPFFFYQKDGKMGFSYDGKETSLQYTHIPHYLCCSASGYNPKPAENMVAFFAEQEEDKFYCELGLFED